MLSIPQSGFLPDSASRLRLRLTLPAAERGYDIQQIAKALRSDVKLVALKAETLISQGYRLRPQEHRSDFLRYSYPQEQ